MPKPKLVPLPKSLRQDAGTFRLEENLPALIAPGSDKEVNAAWSFTAEAEAKAGVSLAVERHGKLDGIGRRILFLIAGRDDALYPKLRALAKPLAKAPEAVRAQAYVLQVTKDEVVAAATSPQGLFYAAQTLRQLLTNDGTIPCVRIVDWPSYPSRGVMLDISRFKVPTLERLFALLERLASLKINVFQLYTEHTFVFRRHPLIGKDCGSMSAEDIIQLDRFCKEHFIDLNANLQSFGHHAHILSIPEYSNLAEQTERPWTLCPGDPRTYRLLDDLYAECLPAYSSKLFNASCDETWDLGKGRSRKRAEEIGVGRVYLEHIKKINDLAHKYGKRMMIWADIILKHPECLPDVPKDILMLEWYYIPGAQLSSFEKLDQAGLEFWTCPGVSTWTRIFANIENACRNISERAALGLQHGATGLLNTDWGDHGHAQMPSASYHGYAWGAEQAWTPNPATSRSDFAHRFAWAWFDDDSGRFGELYEETGLRTPDPWDPPDRRPFRVYWDKFPCTDSLEFVPPERMGEITARMRKALRLVMELAAGGTEHGREFVFGIAQMLFVARKAAVSREINALRESGARKLPAALKKQVRELLDEWNRQRDEFEDLWMATSRRSQIDYRLGLYRKRAADYRKMLR